MLKIIYTFTLKIVYIKVVIKGGKKWTKEKEDGNKKCTYSPVGRDMDRLFGIIVGS